MTELKSVGKCVFCNQEFGKAGLARHLKSHLSKQAKLMEPGLCFHVKFEQVTPGGGGSPYFLHLMIDGDTLMAELDGFLRAIWLECCGHSSEFTKPGVSRSLSLLDIEFIDGDEQEDTMDMAARDILEKGLKLLYEYDFGSTTQLTMTVVDEYPVWMEEGIILLSRNEPLELMCDLCGTEAAIVTCSVCYDENMFCKKCAKQHAKTCDDFADYAKLPVVNSPRMGVCAYEGGRIDKQRDKAFVKKG